MKLSELLSKPFKLKGGGFLNLKGFSKRVVDKEIGGNNNINEFDKLLHLKVPKHSSIYNRYYTNYYTGSGDVPEINLSTFVVHGIDLPIYDSNDNNFFIVLLATTENTAENSMDVSIYDNNLNVAIRFTVAVNTDSETGDKYIVVSEFIHNSDEDYSFIESCIADSVSKMEVEAIRKIIGEPQE